MNTPTITGMRLNRVLVLSALFLAVTSALLLIGATGSVGADSEYEISVAGSIDTPTREVNLEGATYNVSAIGKANAGSTIDVTVSAPDSEQLYRVYLYNSDKQIVKGNTGTGDATLTFELDGLDTGTYMFAVQEQGANKKIHPLVIKGYETTLTMPESATIGDTVTVDISTEQIQQNATQDRVEVVVAGQETQISKSASESGDSYSTTIDTDSFTAGTYRVYANIRGEKVVYDQQEIYGVSDAHTLTVNSQGETTEAPNGNAGGSESDNTGTQSPATEATTTDGPTGNINTQTSASTSEPTVTTEPTTTTVTNTPQTDTGVITPSTTTETPTTIPGFTITQFIGATLLVALIVRN